VVWRRVLSGAGGVEGVGIGWQREGLVVTGLVDGHQRFDGEDGAGELQTVDDLAGIVEIGDAGEESFADHVGQVRDRHADTTTPHRWPVSRGGSSRAASRRSGPWSCSTV
jgi:hypothetical protein